jgi:hypothetical protein
MTVAYCHSDAKRNFFATVYDDKFMNGVKSNKEKN